MAANIDKTSTIFTKLHLEGKPTHDITCLCLCHDTTVDHCEVQLFKFTFTSDTDEALDTLYYRDDFNYSDYEEYQTNDCEKSENEAVLERLVRL